MHSGTPVPNRVWLPKPLQLNLNVVDLLLEERQGHPVTTVIDRALAADGEGDLHPGGQLAALHVRLPTREYDAVYRSAQRERVTMPEYFRQALRDRLRRETPRRLP